MIQSYKTFFPFFLHCEIPQVDSNPSGSTLNFNYAYDKGYQGRKSAHLHQKFACT